ncbi:MAG: hypothetical protein ACYS4W_15465 [Planctomycetota bacterium]|jgi:hypothetical protein
MSIQSRQAKVFTALLISMTTCALLMVALGNNPPSAGAFCLDRYCELKPVQQVVASRAQQHLGRWNAIEIRHSGTAVGNAKQLASLSGLASPQTLNCHFVICNGTGGDDGRIEPTERWQRQWSVLPQSTSDPGEKTIRILLVSDQRTAPPTDYQRKRVEQLVEELCGSFDIPPQFVHYPENWQ